MTEVFNRGGVEVAEVPRSPRMGLGGLGACAVRQWDERDDWAAYINKVAIPHHCRGQWATTSRSVKPTKLLYPLLRHGEGT